MQRILYSLVVAAAVALAALQAAGQTVRVVSPDGMAVSEARVLFVCESGRAALDEASAWMAEERREILPIEELPGDGVGVTAFTNDHGVASTLDCPGLMWSACVTHGDLGAEVALAEQDDDEKPRAVTEVRLQQVRRVLVVGCDGKAAAGVQISIDKSSRIFETDAEGRAAMPPLVATRSNWVVSKGLRWVAPGSDLVAPWADQETVLTLPPAGRLVVLDAEHRRDGRPARLKAGDVSRRMNQGRVAFSHVPADRAIDLELHAGFHDPWRRIVVVDAGETKVVTLREPPSPVVVKGTVAVPHTPGDRLAIFAMFVDRQPGEPAGEAAIEADGSFVLDLASRRPPVARDVGFIVKRGADHFPLESPFAPVRKRLVQPDPDGAFCVGTLTPEVIPIWLAGVVTDMRGRPLRNAVLELFMHTGCGTIGGRDADEVEDPTRPTLEEWPRKIRTDAEGRFSVTGSKDVMGRRFAFRLADRAGRVHHQTDGWITAPALDLRLVAEDEHALWVDIDGGISHLVDRKIDLIYEARRESGDGSLSDCPVIVRDDAHADPKIGDEGLRTWSASAHMRLAPGRWLVTMSVYGETDVISRGQIDVIPASDPEPEYARFRLEVVHALPPEPEVEPVFLHRATVRVVGDGRADPAFTVRMRSRPEDDWSWCEDDGSVALVDFDGDDVEIQVTAPGFFPVVTRVRDGATTIALRAAPETLVHVRVPPFPAGVQADVDWWVWVSGYQYRVAKPSSFDLTLVDPGIREIRLVGGGLTYATREVEVGSGRPVSVDLAVDPESEGMRARTTGIGW